MHFSKHFCLKLYFLLTAIMLLHSCGITEDPISNLLRKARDFEYSKDYEQAEKVYKRIDILIPKKPSSVQLFILLNEARLYLLTKNYSKAIDTCEKGLKVCQSFYGPNDMLNTSFLFVLANTYDQLKQYDKAISIYEKIMTFGPYSHCSKDLVELLPLIKLGDIQFTKNNLSGALKFYREAFAKGEQSRMMRKLICYRLALCNESLDHNLEAEFYFKEALPKMSTDPAPKDIYDKYAVFLAKCGKLASAGLAKRDSLKWYAKHKEYLDWYYSRTGPGSRGRLINSFIEKDYKLVDAIQQNSRNK